MNTPDILKKEWVIPTMIGIASLAGGFAGGYIYGKRKGGVEMLEKLMEEHSEEIFETAINVPEEQSLAELSEEVSRILHPSAHKPGTPEEVAEGFYVPPVEEETDEVDSNVIHLQVDEPVEPITANVFDHNDPGWDWAEELPKREGAEYYILHRDEFMNNEKDYAQETLTYYKGDDIVADQQDAPIYGYHGMMGELLFGHGSDDPLVVYIRNEHIRMEWEVLLHTGRFEVEVLGMDAEAEFEADDLKHSGHRKFRME